MAVVTQLTQWQDIALNASQSLQGMLRYFFDNGLLKYNSYPELYASGSINAANIIGTGAGQFGHANGVTLVAAPGANLALIPSKLVMSYTFATAAYTAGGNITLNWGAGGAAVTGLVSAANSVGAASSKSVMFFPLSTAGVAVVSNVGLSLVAASAFTNPGTAAGVINWEIWYRIANVGF